MKKRSASYPSKPLPEVEKFVLAVFEKVGDTVLKYPDLAKHGNIAVREADSFASTAGQYGWMKQERGKGYAPNSSICRALRTPKNDAEKKKLYLDAYLSPQLYKLIINEYRGKNITKEGLIISLIRDHQFSDPGAKAAAKVFFENTNFLGLIGDDSILNIDAEITIDASAFKEKQQKQQKPQPKSSPSDKRETKVKPEDTIKPHFNQPNGSGAMKKISVFVRGIELHFPVFDDMNQNDWDAVIKQFQNIKTFAK